MPLYEYRCNDCGHHFEKMVPFSEANQRPQCPHCQSQETRKQLSTFASLGGAASPGLGQGSSCASPSGRFT